jgi:hypothetical protein
MTGSTGTGLKNLVVREVARSSTGREARPIRLRARTYSVRSCDAGAVVCTWQKSGADSRA